MIIALITAMADIQGIFSQEIGDLILEVPRTRNKGFYPSVLDAYKRRHRNIDKVILACFVLGLSTRKAAKVQRRPLLCAYGITHEGVCEMIDFHSSQGESHDAWEGFLNDLYKRGLFGKSCELIITDGGKGLHTALEFVYSKIERQRCWAHKTRNILDKVRKKDWDVVKKTLQRGVFTNRESVERIVFAVFHHLNTNWENNPLKEFTHKD